MRIRSNAKQVLRAIEKSMAMAAQTALTKAPQLRRIATIGIQRHFDVGRMGGSMRAHIGKGAFQVISWPHMHDKTKMRYGSDVPPLLAGRKKILERAYIRSAGMSNPRVKDGSALSIGPRAGAGAHNLARVHQLGGTPLSGAGSGPWTVPARPFLFWDKVMIRHVIRQVNGEFESAARRHRP